MELIPKISLKGSTILIAEDDLVTGQLLSSILHKENFKTIICTDGQTALEKALDEQPDLVLLDIMMPALSGFETCRRLKSNSSTQEIPVIFLTAKMTSHDKNAGFDVGGVDYITKPFDSLEVIQRIKTQLRLKKAMDKLREYSHSLENSLNKQSNPAPGA